MPPGAADHEKQLIAPRLGAGRACSQQDNPLRTELQKKKVGFNTEAHPGKENQRCILPATGTTLVTRTHAHTHARSATSETGLGQTCLLGLLVHLATEIK